MPRYGIAPPAARARQTYHKPQDEGSHPLPDLGGDVIAELLQRGEEPLELGELAGAAGRRELVGGEGGGGGGGWPVAEPVWGGRSPIDGGRRVAAPVHHCGERGDGRSEWVAMPWHRGDKTGLGAPEASCRVPWGWQPPGGFRMLLHPWGRILDRSLMLRRGWREGWDAVHAPAQ